MKGVAVIFAVLVVVALATMPGEAAISCGTVQSQLSPCASYLTSGSGEPSAACCSGVKSLQGSLQSQQDRQAACSCLKSAASSLNVQQAAASSLPGKCGVSVGVDISPSVECSQIS